jgi:hypothetical protein
MMARFVGRIGDLEAEFFTAERGAAGNGILGVKRFVHEALFHCGDGFH